MLQIDFINVGSGDAALVRVNDYAALIDCGNVDLGDCRPDSCRISAADFLRREGVQRLDLIVLTHLHRDHIGGLEAVLRAVQVRELWTTYLPDSNFWLCQPHVPEDYPKKARGLGRSLGLLLPALSLAREQGVTLRQVTTPQFLTLTEGLTAEVRCLPPEYYAEQRQALDQLLLGIPDADALQSVGSALNVSSLRLLLTYQGQTALLTGDAYGVCWEDEAVPCTVLKVPHHGSAKALRRTLVQQLSPKTAVISCGAYREDGRPDPQVVSWLREFSGEVLCTDACQVPGLSGENHCAVTVRLGTETKE